MCRSFFIVALSLTFSRQPSKASVFVARFNVLEAFGTFFTKCLTFSYSLPEFVIHRLPFTVRE